MSIISVFDCIVTVSFYTVVVCTAACVVYFARLTACACYVQGEREVKDFVKFIAREAGEPLKNYDREGKRVKKEL